MYIYGDLGGAVLLAYFIYQLKITVYWMGCGMLVIVCLGNFVEWTTGASIKCLSWSFHFPVLLLMSSSFIFGVVGNMWLLSLITVPNTWHVNFSALSPFCEIVPGNLGLHCSEISELWMQSFCGVGTVGSRCCLFWPFLMCILEKRCEFWLTILNVCVNLFGVTNKWYLFLTII